MSVVIVGAGHAAGQLVASLRMEGYPGDIRVIGDEPYPPYQRPPLSKQLLSGEMEVEQVYLKPLEFYADNKVELTLGQRVVSMDRTGSTVTLNSGEVVAYHKLALTTGARVRKLDIPGADLDGIFYVRSIDDTMGLRDRFGDGKKMVVVGGGYIGLEVAAAARKQGMNVTVLEMANRVMNRVVAPPVSEFYARAHREHGVTIVTGATVSGFEGQGVVTGVLTGDGTVYPSDVVVVGVGVIPNVEEAAASGLACDNGIIVDNMAQTADPQIVAAGDCTNHPNGIYGINLRLENVQNAVDQARAAAKAICGTSVVYDAVPWFWSDQYDIKLQIVGLSRGYDQAVVRGNPDDGAFSVFYLRDGILIAVDAINSPREYMMGRKMIAGHARPDAAKIADPAVPVKDLA